MRIFKHSPADRVPTAAHAVAEHALRHALALHGLQPSQIELQWITRLAPGASVMYDGEFHGPSTMTGKTLSDGHDGRTVTIFLRHDVPLELIAETALHEAFHAVQFLYAPLGMRDDTFKAQIEAQAEAFAARHLRDLKGLMASFQSPKRARSRP